MPTPRAEIDNSAAQLDLRMTEGDPMAFNFLVRDVQWASGTWEAHVKETLDGDPVAEMTVVMTDEGTDTDVLLTSAAVPELTAFTGRYFWDLQEVNGLTRFSGYLIVVNQVTIP
jgi:hypothetical protein